jgi:hypothetical protein
MAKYFEYSLNPEPAPFSSVQKLQQPTDPYTNFSGIMSNPSGGSRRRGGAIGGDFSSFLEKGLKHLNTGLDVADKGLSLFDKISSRFTKRAPVYEEEYSDEEYEPPPPRRRIKRAAHDIMNDRRMREKVGGSIEEAVRQLQGRNDIGGYGDVSRDPQEIYMKPDESDDEPEKIIENHAKMVEDEQGGSIFDTILSGITDFVERPFKTLSDPAGALQDLSHFLPLVGAGLHPDDALDHLDDMVHDALGGHLFGEITISQVRKSGPEGMRKFLNDNLELYNKLLDEKPTNKKDEKQRLSSIKFYQKIDEYYEFGQNKKNILDGLKSTARQEFGSRIKRVRSKYNEEAKEDIDKIKQRIKDEASEEIMKIRAEESERLRSISKNVALGHKLRLTKADVHERQGLDQFIKDKKLGLRPTVRKPRDKKVKEIEEIIQGEEYSPAYSGPVSLEERIKQAIVNHGDIETITAGDEKRINSILRSARLLDKGKANLKTVGLGPKPRAYLNRLYEDQTYGGTVNIDSAPNRYIPRRQQEFAAPRRLGSNGYPPF